MTPIAKLNIRNSVKKFFTTTDNYVCGKKGRDHVEVNCISNEHLKHGIFYHSKELRFDLIHCKTKKLIQLCLYRDDKALPTQVMDEIKKNVSKSTSIQIF